MIIDYDSLQVKSTQKVAILSTITSSYIRAFCYCYQRIFINAGTE